MQKTSRRAILVGAASLPALAIPALATQAEPDPIFAMIERHREAERAFNDAIHRHAKLQKIHDDVWRSEFPGIALGEGLNYEIVPGRSMPIMIRTQKDVADLVRVVATESDPRPARAELKKLGDDWSARLRTEKASYKARRAASGLNAMADAEDKYCHLSTEATHSLVNCQPTTRAGLAAFLAYVIEFQKRRGDADADEMEMALETAAIAAKAIG